MRDYSIHTGGTGEDGAGSGVLILLLGIQNHEDQPFFLPTQGNDQLIHLIGQRLQLIRIIVLVSNQTQRTHAIRVVTGAADGGV